MHLQIQTKSECQKGLSEEVGPFSESRLLLDTRTKSSSEDLFGKAHPRSHFEVPFQNQVHFRGSSEASSESLIRGLISR